jgi:hypothetical protein
MLVESQRVIHIGLNYVVAPKRPLTVDEKLQFQKELSLIGLEAENTAKKEGGVGIKALYEGSTVIVETFMNSPNTGQLLILMPENVNTSLFPQIADAVGKIYLKVFTDPKPQAFPMRDGCVRKLYAGGGLRLVIPPLPDNPVETEVRIESLLKDPRQIWIEARMKWPQPAKVADGFRAADLFKQINAFIDENVTAFMLD